MVPLGQSPTTAEHPHAPLGMQRPAVPGLLGGQHEVPAGQLRPWLRPHVQSMLSVMVVLAGMQVRRATLARPAMRGTPQRCGLSLQHAYLVTPGGSLMRSAQSGELQTIVWRQTGVNRTANHRLPICTRHARQTWHHRPGPRSTTLAAPAHRTKLSPHLGAGCKTVTCPSHSLWSNALGHASTPTQLLVLQLHGNTWHSCLRRSAVCDTTQPSCSVAPDRQHPCVGLHKNTSNSS